MARHLCRLLPHCCRCWGAPRMAGPVIRVKRKKRGRHWAFLATKERRKRKSGDGRASILPARKSRSPLPKGEGQGEGEGNVKPAQRPSYQRVGTTARTQ